MDLYIKLCEFLPSQSLTSSWFGSEMYKENASGCPGNSCIFPAGLMLTASDVISQRQCIISLWKPIIIKLSVVFIAASDDSYLWQIIASVMPGAVSWVLDGDTPGHAF